MAEKPRRVARPKRVKLTISMTEKDRAMLESMANAEGVSMSGLIHQWIQRESKKVK